MITLRLGFVCICFVLTLSTKAYANLELELTQGVSGTVPVKLLAFKGESASHAAEIQQVIKTDLSHSGRFNVVAKKAPKTNAEDSIHFDYWRQQHVDNLVQAEIVSRGNQLQVHLNLYDSYKDPHLIANTTLSAEGDAWRDLAHRLSDWIYEKLTGEQGIFSTRLCYVVVVRKPETLALYRLEVADADGARPRILLESQQPIMSPAWSPDGHTIAYVSFESGHSQIYSVNVFTGARRLLTDFTGVNGAPSWSPDGKQLAMVLSHEQHPNIYIYNLVTQRLKQVTTSLAIDTEPQWTRDQSALLFTSDRGGRAQVYRVTLATGAVTRLTFNGPFHASPQLTPDNKSLITLHRANGLYNIAIQDLESGHMRLLTQTGQASSPSISPNGQMVVYAAKRGGRGVLEVVAVDAKVTWRLPSSEGDVQEPAWSPFV